MGSVGPISTQPILSVQVYPAGADVGGTEVVPGTTVAGAAVGVAGAQAESTRPRIEIAVTSIDKRFNMLLAPPTEFVNMGTRLAGLHR